MQLKTYTGPLLLAWPNLSPDPRAIRKYTLLLSWIWGQATKRLDFGARKCIGGTAGLATFWTQLRSNIKIESHEY